MSLLRGLQEHPWPDPSGQRIPKPRNLQQLNLNHSLTLLLKILPWNTSKFGSLKAWAVEVRNSFKGLDLIDRVPDEPWTKVHDIVQETGIKIVPKKKKCKKGKMAVWRGLTNSCEKKRSEKQRRKGKIQASEELQRIARRDKKAFLSYQCKEIEENNRMGNTRNLFKKITDTKVKCHAKMGSIKGTKWYGPNRSRRY